MTSEAKLVPDVSIEERRMRAERDDLRDRLNTIHHSAQAHGVSLGDDPEFTVCMTFHAARRTRADLSAARVLLDGLPDLAARALVGISDDAVLEFVERMRAVGAYNKEARATETGSKEYVLRTLDGGEA